MKINSINTNNILSNKKTFKPRGPYKTTLTLADSTMKVISAAIASTGIAGIELQKEVNDYSKKFSKELKKSRFSDINPKVLEEVMETAPELMDNLISKRKQTDSKRTFSENALKRLLDNYMINPDLTMKLLEEKNDNGHYKYRIERILTILDIYNESPALLDLAKEKTSLIYDLVNKKDEKGNAFYSIEDIKILADALEVNPKYTSELMDHKNPDGTPRFGGQHIKYFLLNGADRNKFLNNLINSKLLPETYKFTPEEIIQINEIQDKNKYDTYLNSLMA